MKRSSCFIVYVQPSRPRHCLPAFKRRPCSFNPTHILHNEPKPPTKAGVGSRFAYSPCVSYLLARLLILHLFSSAEIFLFPTRFVRVATTAWPLWFVVHHNNNRVFRLGVIRSRIFTLKKIDLLGQEGLVRREIIIIINRRLERELPGNQSAQG